MANGLFGKGLSQENTWINYYEVPNTVVVSKATINLVNTINEAIIFDVAISANVTPSPEDFYEYQVTLNPGQIYERSCSYLSPGEKIFIRVNKNDIPVRCSGVEVSGS